MPAKREAMSDWSAKAAHAVTVPLHETLDRGTLRSILRTVDIAVEELARPHLTGERLDFFADLARRYNAYEVAIDALQFVAELREQFGPASGRRCRELR
jgi:hypothetical protein